MQKLFNHILVPVEHNQNSRLVIENAVQVANLFDCDIHLLSVQTPLMSIPFVYEGNLAGSASNDAPEVLIFCLTAHITCVSGIG